VAEGIKKHNECENFAPVDVLQGICRLTNARIFIESTVCPAFEALPKCGGCSYFKNEDSEGIGTCTGLSKAYWTARIYNAALCEGYKSK